MLACCAAVLESATRGNLSTHTTARVWFKLTVCRDVRRRYFIQPTVFADVEDNMTICREEIFGTLPRHQPCY